MLHSCAASNAMTSTGLTGKGLNERQGGTVDLSLHLLLISRFNMDCKTRPLECADAQWQCRPEQRIPEQPQAQDSNHRFP